MLACLLYFRQIHILKLYLKLKLSCTKSLEGTFLHFYKKKYKTVLLSQIK